MRCRLYDRNLRATAEVPGGVRRYEWETADGAMEIDAERLFGAVVEAIDEAESSAREAGLEIAAVGIATFWHGLLGLDAEGEPATPLIGWADTRSAPSAIELRRLLEPEAYHQRTGCFFHASYPLAKLHWLRSERPDLFAGVERWGSIGEFVESRLFGSSRCSLSMASGTGLFNLHDREWDEPSCEAAGIETDSLHALVDYEPVDDLRPEWKSRWPGLAGVPWFPALGDGACANVGAGAIGAERIGLTVGTSAAARVLVESSPEAEVPSGLWCYLLDGRHRVAGGALSNGGNSVVFLRSLLEGIEMGELNEALENSSSDAHRLTVVPSLFPERAGEWAEIDSASIVGIHPETRPLDIAVAWLEAIAQRLAEMVSHIEASFGPAKELRTNGGGLRRLPGWRHIVADASGRTSIVGSDDEATSRGAASMAARAIGWIRTLDEIPDDIRHRSAPDPDNRRRHQNALNRQRIIAQQIRDVSDTFSNDGPVNQPESFSE